VNKSETITELAKALCKAQAEMGGAKKGSDNPFFKSKYADLSSVIQAIKEPFSDNGLSYVQFPIEDQARIGIETILMHSSGEWLSQSFTVQLNKQDAQGAGSAITYCRRYGLQSIAGIPSEDDDGNSASAPAPPAPAKDDKLVVMGKALQDNFESVACIKEAIANNQLETAVEAFNEMSDDDKTALHVAPTKGGIWTIEEYKTFKSNEWSAARKSYYGDK
jgi:hypothetical protein